MGYCQDVVQASSVGAGVSGGNALLGAVHFVLDDAYVSFGGGAVLLFVFDDWAVWVDWYRGNAGFAGVRTARDRQVRAALHGLVWTELQPTWCMSGHVPWSFHSRGTSHASTAARFRKPDCADRESIEHLQHRAEAP